MKLGILVGLLFTSHFAAAWQCEYEYETGKFTVSDGTQKYTHTARSRFDGAKVSCRAEGAALYDGDEFVVFNGRDQQFVWERTERDFPQAFLKSSGELWGLALSEELWVYDASRKRFFHQATERYRSSRLAVGPAAVVFYDGFSLLTYDRRAGRIEKEKTREKFGYVQLHAEGDLIVFYNGDRWSVRDLALGETKDLATITSSHRAWQVASPEGAVLFDGENLIGYSRGKRLAVKQSLASELTATSAPTLVLRENTAIFSNPGKPTWYFDLLAATFRAG